MDALEQLREGDLDATLKTLQDEVRANPADPVRRVFLFQLLSVMGQWDRALTQLNVAGDLDAGTLAMVQTYREALGCEALRESIFAGDRSPLVFGEPERWIALVFEALRQSAQRHHNKAEELRDEAFEEAPVTSGSIDDHSFEWIADGDSRIGPFLEVIVNGNYYWVPFHRISGIKLEDPCDLRDIVWMPAEFTWSNGGQAVGLIPSRYPGSQESSDDRVRLARVTEWQELHENVFAGAGQRMLATDQGEYSLLDVRTISLNTTDAPDESQVPADG